MRTPVSLARSKYSRPTTTELKEALNNSLSFIIVRHPFERLVSAYRDKFSNYNYNVHFREIGETIISATRFKV